MTHLLQRAAVVAVLCSTSSFASGQDLSCEMSPFGGSITLQADREVMLGITGRNTNGVADIFLYNDAGDSIIGSGPPGFSGLSEWESVAVDLNGDGKQETAYAGINGSGNPVVAVVDENAALIDTWALPFAGSNIQIAAVDFVGGQDRKEELFIAFELGGSSVFVAGLSGDANGGITAADGNLSWQFQRVFEDREAFALVSGDFLLEGREQVALVTIGEPGSNRTVFFDFLFREQGQTVDFQVQAAPEDVFSDSIADLKAAAGYFGAAPGPQIAVAIQYETTTNDFPLELWISDFSAQRDSTGQITGISRTTVSQDSGGSSDLPPIPNSGQFDLAVGDVLRDGTDELLLAFANESPEDNLSLWTYKYRPTTLTGDRFPTLARHSYPLSSVSSTLAAAGIDDVSIDVADIDGDGFAEAATAIAFGNNYDLRRWDFEAAIAEQLGDGCDSAVTIGSAACPGTEFLPFPDELEAEGLPAQGVNLGDFRQQPAAGTWELCVADSQGGDIGQLVSWTLRVNDEAPVSSSGVAVGIPDASGSPDACKTIDFVPASPLTAIENVVVEVALTHTWIGDLSIVLKSPLGSSLTLMNRPGRSDTGLGFSADIVAGTPIVFTDRAPSIAQTSGFANPAIFATVDAVTVALPDVDGDSLTALRSATDDVCRSVSESLVQNIVFLPPVFPAVQDRNNLEAQIGQAVSNGQRDGTEVERRSGNSVSGYIGASVGGSALGVTAKASAKATAGRSYESATQQSESSSSELTTSEGASSAAAMAAADWSFASSGATTVTSTRSSATAC